MRCPTDKTRLLKNDSNKPIHQCNDCSGVFVLRGDGGLEETALEELPASPLACPHDGSRLRLQQAAGTTMHVCGKCGGVWLDGETQSRLMSITPDWVRESQPGSMTPGAVAADIAKTAVISILLS
jgi:Zn-finger nucleic acid-binding protein